MRPVYYIYILVAGLVIVLFLAGCSFILSFGDVDNKSVFDPDMKTNISSNNEDCGNDTDPDKF